MSALTVAPRPPHPCSSSSHPKCTAMRPRSSSIEWPTYCCRFVHRLSGLAAVSSHRPAATCSSYSRSAATGSSYHRFAATGSSSSRSAATGSSYYKFALCSHPTLVVFVYICNICNEGTAWPRHCCKFQVVTAAGFEAHSMWTSTACGYQQICQPISTAPLHPCTPAPLIDPSNTAGGLALPAM